MDSLADRALALIKKRGTMRSNQLAGGLGSDEAAVDVALAPHCASGELVRCSVTLIGKGAVNEYRISAAGPRKADDSDQKKPPTPPEAVLAAAAAAPEAAQPRTTPHQPSDEGETMSVHERILAAYKKHGPMTTRQLRKYVDVSWVSVACGQAATQGALVRLGGGARSTIYGLPGQKLPTGREPAAPAKPKKARKAAAKKRSAPVRKVQRKTAKKVQKTVLPPRQPAGRHLRTEHADLRPQRADAGAFRTAIASDGAMIFLGAAAGAFELNRVESRALIEFVRTLDGGTLGA